MISIQVFGKLSVTGPDGQAIQFSGAKTQGLIAYLALNTEMPPTRDRLTTLFWGDRFTEQARQSLRQAITKLKRLMEAGGEDVILTEQDTVGLNTARVSVDVDLLGHYLADGSAGATRKALDLLAGQPLEGIYGQQAEFDDWIASERQRLSTLTLSVLERAAENELKSGNTPRALEIARKIVAVNPLRDAGQMVLIRILAQQGERAAAIQHFNAYDATLRKELDVGPGPELVKLMKEVRGEAFFVAEKAAPDSAPASSPVPGPEGSGRTSVAVVPFGTFASDEDSSFLSEGLTEDVTTGLSRFSWLEVRASGEVSGPRLTSAQMSVLGKELGLDYIVHGSIRLRGSQVRVTVQLAEPSSGRYLWVSRYDRNGDDLFAMQDELSETIAASIEAELERLEGRSSRDVPLEEMNAWECYHRGLAIQYEFNAETNLSAQKHFRRAIELDPNFALAYARLSYAMVISAIYFDADIEPTLAEARVFADRASRLEPDDAVVRFACGRMHLALGNYERSITHLKAALDINPGLAQAHCGLGDSMAYSGKLEEAIGCFEEAVRISPLDPYRWAFLGYGAMAFLFKGDYEAARDWAGLAETVPNSHYWPTAILASAQAHLGEADKAAEAVERLRRMKPGITADFVRSRLFYLRDPKQIDVYVSGLEKAGLE